MTDADDLAALAERVGGRLDGVLHAIAFAPESCLGGGFVDAPWEDVAVAFQVSAYSLAALARAALPLMSEGGSIVGLDFDNQSQAWPVYDWMGVAKSAFESTARYLARELGPRGIRVNLVSAGTDPHPRRPQHPGLRAVRGGVVEPVTARLGHPQPRAGGEGGRRAAVGLVPGDDRRDAPRRRRVPRRSASEPGPRPADQPPFIMAENTW